MRIVRYVALFGSLMLLVATIVSLNNRRSDLRADQFARIEQAATATDASVRSAVTRLRVDVDLVSSAIAAGADSDRELAQELARFHPGAEVCVGATAAGCTGPDLFALAIVAELGESSRAPIDDPAGPVPRATAAVDTVSDAVVVVRQVSDGSESAAVAVRLGFDDLLGAEGLRALNDADATIAIVGSGQDAIDEFGDPVSEGGERVSRTTIGTPFMSGSLEITTSVDAHIGFAGESGSVYLLLLALGTVLLVLAAWTFLVERRHLERRATTDELTSLVNRREFERISEIAIETAQQKGEGLCVMVIDLNGFKQINDTLGHQFGDLVLAAASERFVEAVRDTDLVGRWGGDEFVILLPTLTDRGAVRSSAERIHDRLTSTPVVGDTSIAGSIGAAIYPRHGQTLDALMRAADVAMYEAKTTGVSYRIADTIETNESLFADDDAGAAVPRPHEPVPAGPPSVVETDGYRGPERRASSFWDDLPAELDPES